MAERRANGPDRDVRSEQRHVVVIGGGIGGLSAAWRLLESGRKAGAAPRVTVLEAGPRFGGVIRSTERDGFLFEHGPDSVLRAKPAGIELMQELGLADQLQPTNPNLSGSLVAKGDRLIPIPEGLYLLAPGLILPFLKSSMVSPTAKLRMALEPFLPARSEDLPEESLADFVRRRLGREALERIAQPLVGGIYTADPEKLSLRHCMPQFAEMEREHGSILLGLRRGTVAGLQGKSAASADTEKEGSGGSSAGTGSVSGARYGMFVSLRGGLQQLVDRLLESLSGADLRRNSPVRSLAREGEGYRVHLPSGEEVEAESVVLALPAHAAARLLESLDPALAGRLAAIRYSGVATINIAVDRKGMESVPEAAGFVVPAVEERTVLACTFADRKYLGRCPEDAVLLRAFVGGAMNEGVLELSDDDLLAATLADLQSWFPKISPPRWSEVHRWPKSMAQPEVGHGELLEEIRSLESRHAGLGLVSNGLEGVGIPDIIRQANEVASRILARSF